VAPVRSLTLAVVVAMGSGKCRAADPLPVKLEVIPEQDTVRSGASWIAEVRLLNAANRPVTAPRPFQVWLQARMPSGKLQNLRTVEFAAGESSKKAALTVPGSGLVYVWAKHAELLPGGAYVQIRSESPPPASPLLPRFSKTPVERSLELALRYSPDRAFLADGSDAVTIQAFLVGTESAAPEDIQLRLFDSSGTMQPAPLTIPKGEASAKALLTASQPGLVTVEYLGSAPPSRIEGDQKLQIRFRPPITRIGLRASPPGISLLDSAELIVTLTGSDGRPLASDQARVVSLAIESGRGAIERTQLEIPSGAFESRTRFSPTASGKVSIAASTPNLMTVIAPIEVTLPVALTFLTALGGTAGGYLCYLRRKRSGIRQIWIGLITGFAFYWACIFFGLVSISRGVALNPFGALTLSMAGGWLQTRVLELFTARIQSRNAKA
jgi:hypothetical protein